MEFGLAGGRDDGHHNGVDMVVTAKLFAMQDDFFGGVPPFDRV